MYPLGKTSVYMTCPHCRTAIDTYVILKSNKKTHIMALLFTPLLFCWCPYVTKRYRYAIHYCRMCKIYLGRSDIQDLS